MARCGCVEQFIELCILLGCDYLEPIKGVGPKSALKLMKEHGSLDKVLIHLRAKSEEKAKKVEKTTTKKKVIEEEDVESEDEVMAVTSDVERDEDDFDGGDVDEEEDEEAAEQKRQEKETAKAEAARKKALAASKRGTGGVHVPENWLWEEAKKLFEKPDVTPANEIEVSERHGFFSFDVSIPHFVSYPPTTRERGEANAG